MMYVYSQSKKISEQPWSNGDPEYIQGCGIQYELFTNWYSGSPMDHVRFKMKNKFKREGFSLRQINRVIISQLQYLKRRSVKPEDLLKFAAEEKKAKGVWLSMGNAI